CPLSRLSPQVSRPQTGAVMATTTGRRMGRSAVVGVLGARVRRSVLESAEARLGLLLAAPAIVTILLIAVIPLAQTIQDSLHLIDQPIIFLVRPEVTIWAMVAAEIWKTTPFMALLLLAGLQLIPHELYEAAALDGASRWQSFWRVTLPILRPTILVALLFRTIDAVRMFDLPRVLTNGGPGKSTETVVLYTYNTSFTSLNFGYGSTLAVVIFLIVMFVSFIYIKVLGAPTQGARR